MIDVEFAAEFVSSALNERGNVVGVKELLPIMKRLDERIEMAREVAGQKAYVEARDSFDDDLSWLFDEHDG